MPAPPDLVTVSEVAAAARVSTQTVYRWAQDGTLPTVRVGIQIRFRRADVEAMLTVPVPEASA